MQELCVPPGKEDCVSKQTFLNDGLSNVSSKAVKISMGHQVEQQGSPLRPFKIGTTSVPQSTQLELVHLKLQMEELEQKLGRCMADKTQLEQDLHFAVETALKLQDVLRKQKIVMELEKVVEGVRQHLDEVQVRAMVRQTVLHCICEAAAGAVKTDRSTSLQQTSHLQKKLEELEVCNSRLQAELKAAQQLHGMHSVPSGNGATPLSPTCQQTSCCRCAGFKWLNRMAKPSPEVVQRETVLICNLQKSEYEVEVLGIKVEEQRIVLQKVLLLLDHVDSSLVASSSSEVMQLARNIITQLREFEKEHALSLGL